MALDSTNSRTLVRGLVFFTVPVLFWFLLSIHTETAYSQPHGMQYHHTYAGSHSYGGGRAPHGVPQHSNHYSVHNRHMRYYNPNNKQPCSNYFCSRLDFSLLTISIRPEDRPTNSSTGRCGSAQLMICAADPVLSSPNYSTSYGPSYSTNYALLPGHVLSPVCPAYLCNANFTTVVDGCDRMNCTIIGSQQLLF